MLDEFLVSGEAIIRNLQCGFAIAKEWQTSAMKSGYVVDLFGHNSQFPQLLKGFGIDHAVAGRLKVPQGLAEDGKPRSQQDTVIPVVTGRSVGLRP